MTMLVATCMLLLGAASAMPRYIAVPADQIQFLDLAALQAHARLPRQAHQAPPQYQPQYQPQNRPQYEPSPYRLQAEQEADALDAASEARPTRHAHQDASDYVDFGAHTGQHGAFGWYADFPVDGHH